MSIPFYDLKTFEESIIKYDKNKPDLYILSDKYCDHYGIGLSRLSIFDNEERGTIKQDKKKINNLLKILMETDNPVVKSSKIKELDISEVEKKGIGSMLGMAIGDAMGARYEFEDLRYNTVDLLNMGEGYGGIDHLLPGQWTDDTSMGLCIADSLLMNNGRLSEHDIMHRFIAWWRGGYNNAFRYNAQPRSSVGLGGNISLSFTYYLNYYNRYKQLTNPQTYAGDQNTSGNGSIMRNAAIPICFHKNINLACENAKKQSLITHQGIEAKECCSLLTHIIVKIFQGEKKDDIFHNLGSSFNTDVESVKCLANHQQEGNDENRNWDWTVKQYHYSPYRSSRQSGYIGSYAMDNYSNES